MNRHWAPLFLTLNLAVVGYAVCAEDEEFDPKEYMQQQGVKHTTTLLLSCTDMKLFMSGEVSAIADRAIKLTLSKDPKKNIAVMQWGKTPYYGTATESEIHGEHHSEYYSEVLLRTVRSSRSMTINRLSGTIRATDSNFPLSYATGTCKPTEPKF